MADLIITIPAPALTAGQTFKERYRQLPSGSWSSYANRSNTPFTISGLSPGNYEFEFVLVNADETQCPPVYRSYTIVDDYDCIEFESEMKQDGSLYYIEVTYALPGGFTDPACGWEVEYIQNGNSSKFTYVHLPASGVIKIPCPNIAAILYVRALLCNGRTKECHVNDVQHFTIPPCEPMSGVTMSITEQVVNGQCEFYLNISYTQSNPATTLVHLVINQWHRGIANGEKFNGYVPLTPNATTFRRKLKPLFYANDECTDYYVSFIDACGNGPTTHIPFCRVTCFGPMSP